MTRLRWITSAVALGVAAGLAGGCGGGTSVDVTPLPSDYTSWKRVDTTGDIPGHGDTYRIIYVNDVGQSFPDPPLPREYPVGTIIVKEVHARDGDQPGELESVDIMRKLTDDQAPSGVLLDKLIPARTDGWLFTSAPDAQSGETAHQSCWENCHVAAPIDGAFLDHTR